MTTNKKEITTICSLCGKEFTYKRTSPYRIQSTCSRECAKKLMSIPQRAFDNTHKLR